MSVRADLQESFVGVGCKFSSAGQVSRKKRVKINTTAVLKGFKIPQLSYEWALCSCFEFIPGNNTHLEQILVIT